MDATVGFSELYWKEIGYLQNYGTSIWKFVSNSYFEEFRYRTSAFAGVNNVVGPVTRASTFVYNTFDVTQHVVWFHLLQLACLSGK